MLKILLNYVARTHCLPWVARDKGSDYSPTNEGLQYLRTITEHQFYLTVLKTKVPNTQDTESKVYTVQPDTT